MDQYLAAASQALEAEQLHDCEALLERPPRPGPFAFPLLAERLGSRLSNESLLDRLQRLIDEASHVEVVG